MSFTSWIKKSQVCKKKAPVGYFFLRPFTSTMADRRRLTDEDIFPDMPQAPKMNFPDQPDFSGGRVCSKWKKIGYIVFLAFILISLTIYGINYYFFQAGQIYNPFGGFHWPDLFGTQAGSLWKKIGYIAGFVLAVGLICLIIYGIYYYFFPHQESDFYGVKHNMQQDFKDKVLAIIKDAIRQSESPAELVSLMDEGLIHLDGRWSIMVEEVSGSLHEAVKLRVKTFLVANINISNFKSLTIWVLQF